MPHPIKNAGNAEGNINRNIKANQIILQYRRENQ